MKSTRILSISRRTDIPAFFTPWLLNRLNDGFCHSLNPFNQVVSKISLLPEDVTGMVFWTRNPAPLLKYLKLLERKGFSYYFHFTITGYPRPLESCTPPLKSAIELFKKLSDKISPSKVIWRYDPIIISSITPTGFHLENFHKIASALSGFTDLSIISFVDLYRKSVNRLNSLKSSSGLSLPYVDHKIMAQLALDLRDIALNKNIEMQACCETGLLSEGFKMASCVNPSFFQGSIANGSAQPTRKGCGCFKSVDIGTYSTCRHGCSYCYATVSDAAARKKNEGYDVEDSLLIRPEKYKGIIL